MYPDQGNDNVIRTSFLHHSSWMLYFNL